MKAKAALILVLLVLAVGCQEAEAVGGAKADAIRLEAETKAQKALLEAQTRADAEAQAQLRKQLDWEQTRAAVGTAKTVLFVFVSIVLSLGFGVAVTIGCVRFWQVSAAVKSKANLWAHIVNQGQNGAFPVIVTKSYAHMLETGAVVALNKEREPNEQLVAGHIYNRGLLQAANAATNIARVARDPGAAQAAADMVGTVSGVQPTIRQLDTALSRERQALSTAPIPVGIKSRLDGILARREIEMAEEQTL